MLRRDRVPSGETATSVGARADHPAPELDTAGDAVFARAPLARGPPIRILGDEP
jgi:hypothetical protein